VNKYHIRFNTKHGESDLVWRVFENGSEFLVRNIDIRVPVLGESTIDGDAVKWNIACNGSMDIVNGVAIIT
jgi:hypothetical protein